MRHASLECRSRGSKVVQKTGRQEAGRHIDTDPDPDPDPDTQVGRQADRQTTVQTD